VTELIRALLWFREAVILGNDRTPIDKHPASQRLVKLLLTGGGVAQSEPHSVD